MKRVMLFDVDKYERVFKNNSDVLKALEILEAKFKDEDTVVKNTFEQMIKRLKENKELLSED